MTIDHTRLDDFWMPFTANRQFKAKPRLLESAEGMYFTAHDGRQVLDGTAGLWCCNAGHGRRDAGNPSHRPTTLWCGKIRWGRW